jgi:hypothetical protein
MRFHFRAHDAEQECKRRNDDEKIFKKPRMWYVDRYIFDFRPETYYDIYKHQVKKI